MSYTNHSGTSRPSFFFQAEDGIRDRNVTGVQTCALPIFAESTTATASASTPSWTRGAAPAERSDSGAVTPSARSEEHTSELQSRFDLVCRLLLEKKKR